MKRIEKFDFSKAFGEIDENFIEEAGRSWDKKKVPLYRRYGMKIAAAVIILTVAVSIFSIPDVQAEIWKFSTKIGEVLGIKDDLQPYIKVVDQSKTQNKITVQLNEVILDENCLLLSIKEDIREYIKDFEQEMNSDQISKEEYPQISFTVNGEKTKVNGQPLEYYKSGVYLNLGDWSDEEDKENTSSETDFAANGVQEEVMELRFQDMDYFSENSSKVVRVDTVIEAVNADEDWSKPLATFDYSFYISKEQIQAMTKKKELGIKVPLKEEEELEITEIKMNRIESKIEAKMDKEVFQKYQDSHINLAFRGEDDKGNPVQYNFSSYDEKTQTLLFETDFSGTMEIGISYENHISLAIPDDEAKSLDLQLYEVTYDEEIVYSGDGEEGEIEDLTDGQENVIGGNDGKTEIEILEKDADIDETKKNSDDGAEKDEEKVAEKEESANEMNSEDEDIVCEESIITGENWNPIGERFAIELSELQ